MRRLGAVLLIALAACTGSDDSSTTTSTTTAPTTTISTTTVPTFTGDADSAFCRLVDEAADRPVLDPFEAGLGPREVELRFRALHNRFAEFAEVAPPELDAELDDLAAGLDDLDAVLEANDYDFARVGESGADLDVFDGPGFATTAARIDAYRTQVCAG